MSNFFVIAITRRELEAPRWNSTSPLYVIYTHYSFSYSFVKGNISSRLLKIILYISCQEEKFCVPNVLIITVYLKAHRSILFLICYLELNL